jgi:hypothetical protein
MYKGIRIRLTPTDLEIRKILKVFQIELKFQLQIIEKMETIAATYHMGPSR